MYKRQLQGCNKNFLHLLGLNTIEDFAGISYEAMGKLAQWSMEQTNALQADDKAALQVREGSPSFEPHVYKAQEGLNFYCIARNPLMDEKGKPMGMLVLLGDIEEHKKIHDQLNIIASREVVQKAENDGPPRILVVEDSLMGQKIVHSLLSVMNCQVDVASTGDNALLLFEPGKYDLVFMDISLEDTTGYMVAKKFRDLESGTQNHVPIIALTIYEAEVIKYDCAQYKMDGALTKPLSGEQAKQLIQHYVYHKNIAVRGLKLADDENKPLPDLKWDKKK